MDPGRLELMAAALRASIATTETATAQMRVALDVVEAEIADQAEEATAACPRCGGQDLVKGGERDGAEVLVCPCGANVVNGALVSG